MDIIGRFLTDPNNARVGDSLGRAALILAVAGALAGLAGLTGCVQ